MNLYATSLEHILAEFERIDLLIQLQVGRARQLHTVDEQFQGIYIPEEGIGVRSEDDILITETGHTNLSSALSTSL